MDIKELEMVAALRDIGLMSECLEMALRDHDKDEFVRCYLEMSKSFKALNKIIR